MPQINDVFLPACAGIVISLLGASCASVPAPHARVASAQSALRAAEEVGAARVPSAALHLQLAREEIVEAQKFMDKGLNARAEMVLKRAEADADLSLALAHEAPMRIEAQDAIDRLNRLQDPQLP